MIEPFEGTQRFAIARTLGAGSFGVVYEAVDQLTGGRVALKTLKNISPESLYRFKREFRFLCDIAHPNLVQLYELFADEAGWFFTMELVDGIAFTQYTAHTPSLETNFEGAPTEPFTEQHPLDVSVPRSRVAVRAHIPRLEIALPQLVRAVAKLHNEGYVHRDLKPSNVLVTTEGRVVVLDFGLVMDFTADSGGSIQLAGTPAYMSPEQARGAILTPASDWYSIGAMLYETLTGEAPFAGQPLRLKQSHEPPPPGELVGGIPTILNQLCIDLLRLDPDARPDAAEILERLERRAPHIEPVHVQQQTPFVGRQADLAALRKAFDESQATGAVVVCVEGVSGIGKSALVREFIDIAGQRTPVSDLLVLSGRCYERESVPYKAVDAIIDELQRHLRDLDPRDVQALLPRDFIALTQLFPVLQSFAGNLPPRRAQVSADSQELRRRGFIALRELFQRISDRKRTIVFVDDVQWGDVDSADMLAEILRGPDAPELLFIAAYRSDEVESSPFLRAFLNPRTGITMQRIQLGPLSPLDVRNLAGALLGDAASDKAMEFVAEGAAGSPFLVDTLVRAIAIDGTVDALPADTAVAGLLQRILKRLDPEAQRLLHLIAMNGRPIPTALLHTAMPAAAYQAGIGVLRSEHLVRTVGERESVEIYHDRMREMIVSELPDRARRRYHRVLLDLLEADERTDAELLAVHAVGAEDRDRAATYLVRAAEKAASALAFDRAAGLYGRALDIIGDRDERFASLKTQRAEMLSNAGRGAEAAAEYLAVPTEDPLTKLQLRTKAAQQLLFSGFIDRGLDLFRTVLAAAGMRWPKTQLQTMRMFLIERIRLLFRGLKMRERQSEVDVEQLIRLDTSWSVAIGLSTVDPPRGAVFQTRHLRLALDAGEPNRVIRALAAECAYSGAGGEPARRRTEKLLRNVRNLASRMGTPAATAYADLGEGVASHLLGAWQLGASRLERCEETFLESCTGVTWELDTARLFGLRCRWYLGDTQALITRTPRLMREARERGDQYFSTMIRVCLAPYALLANDEPARAVSELEAAMREWSPSGLQYQHIWYIRAMTDAALYRNDAMMARLIIEDFWPVLTKSLLWRVQFTRVSLMEIRARVAIAAARSASGSERDELHALAREMARKIDSEKTLWGRPFASIIRACTASDGKSTAESLVEAARRAERCAMKLYESAARIRLARVDPSARTTADADVSRDWMRTKGVRNPDAMTAMLIPLESS